MYNTAKYVAYVHSHQRLAHKNVAPDFTPTADLRLSFWTRLNSRLLHWLWGGL